MCIWIRCIINCVALVTFVFASIDVSFGNFICDNAGADTAQLGNHVGHCKPGIAREISQTWPGEFDKSFVAGSVSFDESKNTEDNVFSGDSKLWFAGDVDSDDGRDPEIGFAGQELDEDIRWTHADCQGSQASR